MKKTISSLLAIIVLFMSGCSESFLDSEPRMVKVGSSYYRNADEVFQGLVGCYQVLRVNNWDNIFLMSEVMSDNCYGGAGTDGTESTDDRFVTEGNTELHINSWEKYNVGIHRCNMVLSKIDEADFTTNPELRSLYKGEARFLRAYFYFDYVRIFGNVPLSKTAEEGNFPQAPADSIYSLIAQDLIYAIENCDSTAAGAVPAEFQGRATKWAAESLLARVYLFYSGYYGKTDIVGVVDKAKVTSYINEVIDKGGYELVEDFRSLWPYSGMSEYTGSTTLAYAGEGNSEVVFSIKYSATGTAESYVGTGNTWLVYMGWRGQTILPFHYGWGFAPVTPKVWNSFENGDLRKVGSILSIKDENFKTYATTIDQRDETYLWQKKYQPLSAQIERWQYGQGQDFYVIRFSDVLLMGAELNLESDLAYAQQCFNKVRERAFGDTNHNTAITKEIIMKERNYELAFEGLRYWDLLRQGLTKAKSELDVTNGPIEIGGDDTRPKNIVFRTETGGFQQIPKTQIDLSNGVLVQNPGWTSYSE